MANLIAAALAEAGGPPLRRSSSVRIRFVGMAAEHRGCERPTCDAGRRARYFAQQSMGFLMPMGGVNKIAATSVTVAQRHG